MRQAVVLGGLLGCVSAAELLTEPHVKENGRVMWREFKAKHNRSYSASEDEVRFGYFMENMVRAAESQKNNPRATFGLNKFSDLSRGEFASYHNHKVSGHRSPVSPFSSAQIAARATSVDWRKHGAVTPVKDQGQCGSCWAFSATGGIEGQWFMAGNALPNLSEQQLVSCDKVDYGCNGGEQDTAFTWLVNNTHGGITGETAYPYKSGGGSTFDCLYDPTKMPDAAVVAGHKDLKADEAVMATWVGQNGPLPVSVDAGHDWQSYTGGVLTKCPTHNLDHAVLIVGYTADYWIVKNSWAKDWGEEGYIRIAYGSGQCGIDQYPEVPVVASNSTPRVFSWQAKA
eukprot:Hpha_TRINITY_DN18963_c0_g1::TRINITY_DN18963_c0_g1_i1::g.17457::m.17457